MFALICSSSRWLRVVMLLLIVLLAVDMGSACAPATKPGDETTQEKGTQKDAAASEPTIGDQAGNADETGNTDQITAKDQTPTQDKVSTDESRPCRDDCDCGALKMVCENGFCSGAERDSKCPSCKGDCTPGERCFGDEGVGTCPQSSVCKSDCDCKKMGMNCEGDVCAMTDRANSCPECGSANCPPDTPCLTSEGKPGMCVGTPVRCKHDCDCTSDGKVCQNGTCLAMGRPSLCLPCDGKCTKGEPCLQAGGSIGTCVGDAACKNDCECRSAGLNCDSNKCNPSKRLNKCPACTSANCPKGDACYHPDNSLGTCGSNGTGTACQNDCECVTFGLNCDSNKCSPSRRVNTCPVCGSANCPAGDPCYDAAKKVGTCGKTLPSCSDKNCKPNTECMDSGGRKAYCCCTIAGCNSGQICCVTSGVNPGPGRCASSCLTATKCPPPPP